MERRKRDDYDDASYPSLAVEVDRRKVLAGLGIALGGAVFPALTGCVQRDIQGLVAGPGVDEWSVSLPPAPDVQTLFFYDEAFIDYSVEIWVGDVDLADAIATDGDGILAEMDDLLGGHSIYEFAPGEDLTDLQAELLALVEDRFSVWVEGDPHIFGGLTLNLHAYDEGEQIDGLVG